MTSLEMILNKLSVSTVAGHSYHLKTMQDTHWSYDPLAYPLFFPKGNDGWHLSITSTGTTHTISLNEYTSFHIMPHATYFNVLHHGNKLFQQWLVDKYCKIESAWLRYIKNNQKHLHADTYEAIQQAVQHGQTTSTTMVSVILPSSVTGSPQYMHENVMMPWVYALDLASHIHS